MQLSGISIVSQLLKQVIMEHVEYVCSSEPKLFFISKCSIRIHSKVENSWKTLQHISNPYPKIDLYIIVKTKSKTRMPIVFKRPCHIPHLNWAIFVPGQNESSRFQSHSWWTLKIMRRKSRQCWTSNRLERPNTGTCIARSNEQRIRILKIFIILEFL